MIDFSEVVPTRTARIRVPASTSNLGAAFDSVGLALQLYLTLDIRQMPEGPSVLEFRGRDADLVPSDESNLIWRTMEEVASRNRQRLPAFYLDVKNQIPITKGLGSSASAYLAGVAAGCFLCRARWQLEEILEFVTEREGHPDNAAPALLGGLVASISSPKILCSRTEFPADWSIVAVTPESILETKKARGVLPQQISHSDAVFNVQRAAFLMAQLTQGRRDGLREAMKDRLHQPYRSYLLPGLEEILDMEGSEGLLGVALSGAGSTVVAFADSRAERIGEQIRDIFAHHGLASQVRILRADNQGLVIEEIQREE